MLTAMSHLTHSIRIDRFVSEWQQRYPLKVCISHALNCSCIKYLIINACVCLSYMYLHMFVCVYAKDCNCNNSSLSTFSLLSRINKSLLIPDHPLSIFFLPLCGIFVFVFAHTLLKIFTLSFFYLLLFVLPHFFYTFH